LCSGIKAAQPIIWYRPATNAYTSGTAITTTTAGTSHPRIVIISYAASTNFAMVTDFHSVATDASGNIYKINRTLTTYSEFCSPNDLAVNAANNVYIVNSGTSTIKKNAACATTSDNYI